MSDQGTKFYGNVIAAMCSLLGIEKIRMMPYHPQTNGSAERVHQTLQCMIGKLDSEKRKKWLTHIGSIIIAYNSTWSLVRGVFPVLSYVQEEALVANRPVVPNTQDTDDDSHHRRICSQSVRSLTRMLGDRTGLH